MFLGAAFGGKRNKEQNLYLDIIHNGALINIQIAPSKSIGTVTEKFLTLKGKAIKENPKTIGPNLDVASQIEKLHELYTKGVLTETEFKTRKAKLLN